MFSLASGLYQRYWAPSQLNILVIGNEGVGKSTLLERIKVTEFSRKTINDLTLAVASSQEESSRSTSQPQAQDAVPNEPAEPPKRQPLRRRLCPAPAKYAVKLEDDDDDDEEEKLVKANNSNNHRTSKRTASWSSSMEDIPIDEGNDTSNGFAANNAPQEEEEQEYDLKKGAHMLSLDKIRPTIGMNLARVDICGAKCHFWDLGGKMRDIWPKYYADADAVIICVPNKEQPTSLINILRKELPNEETPILVFCNCNENSTTIMPVELSPLVGQFVGSAKTGRNVRAALEWLTSLAIQQQRLIRKLS